MLRRLQNSTKTTKTTLEHHWTFTIDNTGGINTGTTLSRSHLKKVYGQEFMQYDYFYQQNMEKIDHKKGIEACLNEQGRKTSEGRQQYEIGNPYTVSPRSCACMHMFWDGIRPLFWAVIHRSSVSERRSRFKKSRSG
jgi:hypothetical protein